MEKINGKDLITIGIFTLLILVVASVAPILGIIPGMYLMRTPAVALLCGPVYLLYVAKTKKPFCITITGLICASVMGLLSFGSFPMFAINLACFLAAELIACIGKYKSKLFNAISYVVLGFWTFAQDGAFWYMKDFMLEFSHNAKMDEAWLNMIVKLLTVQNLIMVLCVTLVCSIVSVIFSNILFKKHFKKAGII